MKASAAKFIAVLTLIGALALGCGNAPAEETASGDCSCYTSDAHAYGTAAGKETLKKYLADAAAQSPEGSVSRALYRSALNRFAELEPYYADKTLTPEERWEIVNQKLSEMLWPRAGSSNQTAEGNAP